MERVLGVKQKNGLPGNGPAGAMNAGAGWQDEQAGWPLHQNFSQGFLAQENVVQVVAGGQTQQNINVGQIKIRIKDQRLLSGPCQGIAKVGDDIRLADPALAAGNADNPGLDFGAVAGR